MIESLKWRYATKKFDTEKKVSDAEIAILKEAINLTPSSYGLQPYKVLDVQNAELREKLKAASFGQPQVTDASHLFVFVANDDLTDAHIDAFIELTAKTQQIAPDGLKGYGDFMKGVFGSRTPEQKHQWAARQAYIALGTLVNVAAEMGLDVSSMEGFDPAQYDEILQLKGTGYSTVVIAAIGYRSVSDEAQFRAKVRKPLEEIFQTIR
ncbi:MAG: NAD(P)H-dependent oxidoreductase [Paludibacter sp.]|nr:NAD(P)H-dependent oxidoreductase [Paludibacter sp.]